MGTDIHLVVETREDDDAPWCVLPGQVFECWHTGNDLDCWLCGPWSTSSIGTPGFYAGEWYDSRNYVLFAVLADVRNGYGFAGAYRHEPVNPISVPRGLPLDISDAARDWLEARGDHSASWLDLREINDFDWAGTIVESGEGTLPLIRYVGDFLERIDMINAAVGDQPTRLVFNFDS